MQNDNNLEKEIQGNPAWNDGRDVREGAALPPYLRNYKPSYANRDGDGGGTDGGDDRGKKEKKPLSFPAGLLVGLILGICLCAMVCIVALVIMFNTDSLKLSYSATEKLGLIKDMIRQHYLKETEITDEKIEDGMYKGMMESLGDPYSVYYTEDEYRSMKESTSGSFGGVGILMTQGAEDRAIKVYKVIEDSPADKAGVKDDDILIRVDGESVENEDLNAVVAKVRGEIGSRVLLTFLRGEEEVDIEIVRDTIERDTVTHRMQDDDNKIGYIYIAEFDTVTYKQFMEALDDLKSQGMESLLIDLRENPGGNVDTVCDIADELMGSGRIFYVRDKNGKGNEYTSDANTSWSGPMAVLVDGNSASSAEILTGALKDNNLATIIGTKTFGKGIVQSLYPLGDGTAVKITVEDYFTSGGHNIHGIGIEPDVEVELDKDAYLKDGSDNQLKKAVEVLGGVYVNKSTSENMIK